MQTGRFVVIGIARAAVIVGLCLSAFGDGVQAQTRNAIFNGTFAEGTTGFAVLGPGHSGVALTVDRSQFAHVLVTEMIVSSPAMERTFSVYSTYLLQVRPDVEYQMALNVAGEGHFAFGAFEYDENGKHIGNKYSERHLLTAEPTSYRFTYRPSNNAVGIRPSIVFFESPDARPMDVRARIGSFELQVDTDEFSRMCRNWPEYARDDSFTSYPGFSEDELAELALVATVDTVLPPYRPIEMGPQADFTLTTSRVRFGQGIFPESISILDRDVLVRPIEFTVEYADGAHETVQPSRLEVRATERSADLRQRFRAGQTDMRVSLEMDYDAFLIYTVSLPPAVGASVTGARLSIPLAPEVARYINYSKTDVPQHGGMKGWVFGYGPIPGRGETVETKHVIGSEHMGGTVRNDWQPPIPGGDGLVWEWSSGPLHTLWIGDEQRGISIVSMSDQGYATPNGHPTARLVLEDGAVSLTYSFITSPVSLEAGREFQFALQLMPPKPVRDDWFHGRYHTVFVGYPDVLDQGLDILDRTLDPTAAAEATEGSGPEYSSAYDWIRSQVVPRPWAARAHRQYRDTGFLWYTFWSLGSRESGLPVGGCSTPLVGHPDRLAKVIRYSELLGHRGLPYFAATHIASEDPAGYYYVERTDEWTQLPRVPRPPYLRPTCPNSMFSAYIARGIGTLIDDYGIEGVYFDNCGLQMCENQKHGCGYVDEHGALRPTLPVLGFRKLFMMVRNEFVKRGKEPLILTHAGMQPGLVSFIDVQLDGEGTYGSDHTEMISLGEWRARFIGPHQFGVQQTYLPSFGYGLGPDVNRAEQEVIGTPRLLAMSLLHGTHIWRQYVDSAPVYAAWRVLDELDEPDVAFIPYWDWPDLNAALHSDGIYATAYAGKTRLLLVLANLSDAEREVRFPLSDIGVHLRDAGRVVDNMHDLPVSIDDGLVKCAVGPKSFRLLSFTP